MYFARDSPPLFFLRIDEAPCHGEKPFRRGLQFFLLLQELDLGATTLKKTGEPLARSDHGVDQVLVRPDHHLGSELDDGFDLVVDQDGKMNRRAQPRVSRCLGAWIVFRVLSSFQYVLHQWFAGTKHFAWRPQVAGPGHATGHFEEGGETLRVRDVYNVSRLCQFRLVIVDEESMTNLEVYGPADQIDRALQGLAHRGRGVRNLGNFLHQACMTRGLG